MKTERLFDTDAFIFSFEAQVLSCEKQGKYYAAVLDKTAFFPEGGGQPADKGTLGGESVCDVQEREGIIYHYVKAPLGGTVQGVLDSNTRFCRMQNHSGEHVVSGIIHRLTGADNISFTLTDSETTLAFNVPLSEEMLAGVEREANDVVFRDVPISAYYPDSESLAALDYRSKLELSENVRLVEIAGTDLCACCAPHCRTTGQIGLIKIVASERYKGGTKLWIHCGSRALAHYALLLDEVTEIFEVPLDYFFNTQPQEYGFIFRTEPGPDFPFRDIPGGRNYRFRSARRPVYFYYYKRYVIWGMTAYIMRHTAEILRGVSDE